MIFTNVGAKDPKFDNIALPLLWFTWFHSRNLRYQKLLFLPQFMKQKNIVLISEVPAMKPDKTMKWQCNIMIFWIFGSNICEK